MEIGDLVSIINSEGKKVALGMILARNDYSAVQDIWWAENLLKGGDFENVYYTVEILAGITSKQDRIGTKMTYHKNSLRLYKEGDIEWKLET